MTELKAVAGVKAKDPLGGGGFLGGCDLVFDALSWANKPESVEMGARLPCDALEIHVEDYWVKQGGGPHEVVLMFEYQEEEENENDGCDSD
jgi:hypothetical protein